MKTPAADLTYEQARDELITIVGELETGKESLDDAMNLWERGEELAAHCENFLNSARERIRAKQEAAETEESQE